LVAVICDKCSQTNRLQFNMNLTSSLHKKSPQNCDKHDELQTEQCLIILSYFRIFLPHSYPLG